jgi:hypothetical protein
MEKDARRKPNMTCGCNHKRANLANLRPVKKKKTWKGKKGSEKGPVRDFTRGTLINAIKSNTSIRATAHSGAGYKFDDEEQAGVYFGLWVNKHTPEDSRARTD